MLSSRKNHLEGYAQLLPLYNFQLLGGLCLARPTDIQVYCTLILISKDPREIFGVFYLLKILEILDMGAPWGTMGLA
jgi:hypothetical protein